MTLRRGFYLKESIHLGSFFCKERKDKMKEIKNTTIYTEELVKDFLNIYYKEKTKKLEYYLIF